MLQSEPIYPKIKAFSVYLVLAALVCASSLPAWASVVRVDESPLVGDLKVPMTHWYEPQRPVRGVVLAIHGVTLHSGSYDSLGRKLAGQGFLVIAPDMRGYGRWRGFHAVPRAERRVKYRKSYADCVQILGHLRKRYADLPIFCAGESIGANMAIWLGANHPDLVDGLILSSPGVWRRIFLRPEMAADFGSSLVNPVKQLDMGPYIRKRLSDDERTLAAYKADPLVRKTLSVPELIESKLTLRFTQRLIAAVPATMPVLIMQGTSDRLYKPEGVKALKEMLKSGDTTVELLPDRGHLLLETPYIPPEALMALSSWLARHADPATFATISHLVPAQSEPANED